MKILKIDHSSARSIAKGEATATWRIYDDKDIKVNDLVSFIDKVDAQNPSTWVTIASAVVDMIIEKRLEAIVEDDYGGSGLEPITGANLVNYFRQRYGPHVDLRTPVKIIHFTPKETKNEAVKTTISYSLQSAKLFADGGSRGNPGPSAGGFAIVDMQGETVVKRGLYLGITTNNQAEYQALKLGLEEAASRGIQELHIYMDSMLVVNQMRGVFKVKNRDLWPIHESIKLLLPKFKTISFTHIPRELNKLADSMANEAMDAAIL